MYDVKCATCLFFLNYVTVSGVKPSLYITSNYELNNVSACITNEHPEEVIQCQKVASIYWVTWTNTIMVQCSIVSLVDESAFRFSLPHTIWDPRYNRMFVSGFPFVYFVILCSFRSFAEALLTCKKDPLSSCRCTTNDGRIFDLSPIASNNPHKPQFRKLTTIGFFDEIFEYNPCFGISCSSLDKNDNAVCNKFGIKDYVSFEEI